MLEDIYVKLFYQLIKSASSEMSKRKKEKKKKLASFHGSWWNFSFTNCLLILVT